MQMELKFQLMSKKLILELDVVSENATVGVPSLSPNGISMDCNHSKSALFGLDKVKITVSLPSDDKSSIIPAIVMVPLVSSSIYS